MVRQVALYFAPEATVASVSVREALYWICAVALLVLIRKGERLPLTSVGIGTSPWWKSILWGFVIAVICGLAAVVLAHVTGYGHGPGSKTFEKLPLGLVAMIVVRAGVVEEFFYRGFPIERLQALGLSRFLSAGIPLVIFATAHWTGGAANILIAFVLGAILAGFYLLRRDLVANMIGHFLVDFVGNVLPRLFS